MARRRYELLEDRVWPSLGSLGFTGRGHRFTWMSPAGDAARMIFEVLWLGEDRYRVNCTSAVFIEPFVSYCTRNESRPRPVGTAGMEYSMLAGLVVAPDEPPRAGRAPEVFGQWFFGEGADEAVEDEFVELVSSYARRVIDLTDRGRLLEWYVSQEPGVFQPGLETDEALAFLCVDGLDEDVFGQAISRLKATPPLFAPDMVEWLLARHGGPETS